MRIVRCRHQSYPDGLHGGFADFPRIQIGQRLLYLAENGDRHTADRTSKHHSKLLSPFYPDSDPLHFDLLRKESQHRFIGRMKVQRRSHQQQPRRIGAQFQSRKITAPRELATLQMPLHPHPVIQRLKRKMDVLGRFHLDDRQPSGAIRGENVQHAALPAGEFRHLAIQWLRKQRRVDVSMFPRTWDSSQASGWRAYSG